MTAREPRIDILRGCAILVILVNHITQVVEFGGLRGGMIPTPTRYGYSTAAELFVILSGYMVGLVYLARPHAGRAILRRAAKLWVYDVALLTAVLPLLLVMPSDEAAFWHLDSFMIDPLAATTRFLTLQAAPRLLDVLQLYIRLMLVAPIAILIHRRSPRAAIAISVALYLVAQLLTFQLLAAAPDATRSTALDLLAWQLLFFVPMALGARKAHVRLFAWLDANWTALVLLLLLFVAAAIVKQLQADALLTEPEWFKGRYGLNLLRLSHAVLVLLLYASALTLARRHLERQPFRAVATIGRHSLACFAVGVIVTYGLGTLWNRVGGGHATYYLFVATGIAITLALAYRLEPSERTTEPVIAQS